MPIKETTKKATKAIKIIRAIISLIGVMLILCLSAYLIVHSYINKMNLVRETEIKELTLEPEQIVELELEPEDMNTDVADSPEEIVVTVDDKIRTNMEEDSTAIRSDKDVFNVLLIGSDTRTVEEIGRSDAMIIVSINKNTKTIIATSLLRDIYLQIPGKSNNRINIAYAYGGADLLMDTIEQNFKCKIDRYVSIDFYSFMDVVDAVGGVTLEVTEEEIPIINNLINSLNGLTGQDEGKDILTESGIINLNGKQALGYARNRYIGTDFERTARQRRVLEQLFIKVKELGLVEMNNLLNIILPQVTTNLTEGELFSMILNLPSYRTYALEQWSVPVKDSYTFMRIRGMDVIGIDFQKNINEIHKRIYGEDK